MNNRFLSSKRNFKLIRVTRNKYDKKPYSIRCARNRWIYAIKKQRKRVDRYSNDKHIRECMLEYIYDF